MASLQLIGRALVIAGAGLGCLSIAPAAALGDEPPAPSTAPAQRKLIACHGSGEVRVRPDAFRVDLGAEVQGPTLEAARAEAHRRMERVLAAERKLELEGLVLETSALEVNPIYTVPKEGAAPVLAGYRVVDRLHATLRDADPDELGTSAARILDAADDAGANAVSGLELYLADPSTAERSALALAVEDAEQDAEAMAAAAHVTLAGLVSLEEGQPDRLVPFGLALDAHMAKTPIAVGEATVRAEVTARFEFR